MKCILATPAIQPSEIGGKRALSQCAGERKKSLASCRFLTQRWLARQLCPTSRRGRSQGTTLRLIGLRAAPAFPRGDDDMDVGAHPLAPKPTVIGDSGAHPLAKPPAAATDAGGAKWIRHPLGDWENVGKRPGAKPAAVVTPKPAAPAPAPAPDPAPADDDTGELASGGTAQQGRSYRVGERGPELFTPRQTGEVSTAAKLVPIQHRPFSRARVRLR